MVIARRLCRAAQARQILCSVVVPGLLIDQPAFGFGDCAEIEVEGLGTAVS